MKSPPLPPHSPDPKAELREKLRKIRSQVTPSMAEAASQSLWNILSGLREFKKAEGVGAFASTPGEINTYPLLESSLETGKRVYLPRVAKGQTHFDYFRVEDLKNLVPGSFGIPEPSGGRPADWAELDLVLVPGLAFDGEGRRLGHGFGYFDRALPRLKKTALTVGLAYSFQIVEKVPTGPLDIPVKALLTEKGFTLCRSR